MTKATSTPRSTAGSPLTSHASIRRLSSSGKPGEERPVTPGPRRHISLSEVEILPWLCCMAPAFCLFTGYGSVLFCVIFAPEVFYFLTSGLTLITLGWFFNLCFSSMIGAYNLRRDTQVDWDAKLQEAQESGRIQGGAMHIIILPNYKENEKMLQETLENIGQSPLALDNIHIVLGMEQREGDAGIKKADSLIQATEHLFADMLATYHPDDLPGEVVGKSSNTQWAYRRAKEHWADKLSGCDLSRVFVSVGDADTMWHPQYFSALSYSGLNMSPAERSWRIWQPPVLLMRNLDSVGTMIRATSHATLIFELAGLGNQLFFPALAYSSYSLTLALTSHPEVDGWDADVIAEDHHMWCKCYFASLWDSQHEKKKALAANEVDKARKLDLGPRLKVQPIFLPAVSYLVEGNGFFASLRARFQQARRHSQGIVELGYVFLQYSRLAKEFSLPIRSHGCIATIVVKLFTLHVVTTTQCFALNVAISGRIVPCVLQWIMNGGISSFFASSGSLLGRYSDLVNSLDSVQQALLWSMNSISYFSVIWVFSVWWVVKDLKEGTYHKVVSRPSIVGVMPPVLEGVEASEASSTEKSPILEGTTNPLEPLTPTERKPSFVTGTYSRLGLVLLW
eukprot:CAMPEP_0169082250 /NCGR_PEP_ID=MMETSP1015-20121227/11444_1 /TAXON_ID=342587 /ORGANISM="Karlodinium micrum, Strain CCMP2283" /LENGTH=621 /DNA_ID=CAMNT_0009142093 /DNA_START=236 /DNA_END=2098 /DNA_ORIENTATION=+